MKYEFKGTPAPWYMVQYANYFNINDEPFYEAKNITDADSMGEDAAKANAILMAAAPDLLEAAINILSDIEDADIWPMNENMSKLKQAIHKALNIN